VGFAFSREADIFPGGTHRRRMGGEVPDRELFIGGEWVRPVLGGRLPCINPATEQPMGRGIPRGTAHDVDAAVKAAASAFPSWAATSGSQRGAVLRKIAFLVMAKKAALSRIETLDCGKPIQESEWDLDDVAGCFEYFAGLAEALDAAPHMAVDVGMEEFRAKVQTEPLGVVGLISPWNYPMLMATWKVAPALAAGCTCVLKPSELASLTCLELAGLASEAGVPQGVLNVVTGLGAEAGAALAAHPRLDKVAFTGSVGTGRRVMKAVAENVRPVTLELGGKSPLLVFDDADVDKAVEWCMFGAFWTNGQICSATSRLLVQEKVAPALLRRLKERTEAINIAPPLEEASRLGPVVSQEQLNKVMAHIKGAVAEGAVLLTGGRRPPSQPVGYWVEPTVLVNVTPSMAIFKEEVFGPVLSVTTFRTEAEGIHLANDTPFGLGMAVISADSARCARVVAAVRAGLCWVNCAQPCFCQLPWGGCKDSGFGRELGEFGMDAYRHTKQVVEYVSQDRWDWYPLKSKL